MRAFLIAVAAVLLPVLWLRARQWWGWRWKVVRVHAAGLYSFQQHEITGKRRCIGKRSLFDRRVGVLPLPHEPWLKGEQAFSEAAWRDTISLQEAEARVAQGEWVWRGS